MRLGRNPHNPVAIAQAPRLADHYSVPAKISRANFVPILANNDTLPTCTVAGLLNGASASESISTGGGLAIANDSWLAFYASCAGCAPTELSIGQTDGLVMLDVLRRQGTQGFDIGEVAPLTGDFGTVALDRNSLISAINHLGWVYAGIDLFQSDMNSPNLMEVPSSPGSLVGGHCICLVDYSGLADQDTVTAASWGQFIRITWARWDQIAQEAYGVLFPLSLAPGINLPSLKAANAQYLGG